MLLNYLFCGCICVLALFVMLNMISKNTTLQKEMKKMFTLSSIFTMTIVAVEVIVSLIDGNADFFALSKILHTIKFGITPFIPVFISLSYGNQSKYAKYLFFPALINAIVSFATIFTGSYYTIDESGKYHRGNLFVIFLVFLAISMAWMLVETVIAINKFQNKNKMTLIFLYCFVLFGTVIQMAVSEVHTLWFSFTCAIIIYYAYFCELTEKYDVLTKLLNRRAYENELDGISKDDDVAIILLDVDEFKGVNDTYGHNHGDICLSIIGEAIQKTFNKIGFCYRTGGDEFCVICKGISERTLLNSVKEFNFCINDYRVKTPNLPTTSVGYAFSTKSEKIRQTVVRADKSLYNDKAYKKSKKAEAILQAQREILQ